MDTVLIVLFFVGLVLALPISLALAVTNFTQAKMRQYELQDAFSRASYMRSHVGSGYSKEEADEARKQAENMLRAAAQD